tara:strand:+ start:2114 stop:2263 length:150 start_codon:yes stop_codon:yes gene_type:complete
VSSPALVTESKKPTFKTVFFVKIDPGIVFSNPFPKVEALIIFSVLLLAI